MFKTIFSKLIFVFISILVISFAIAGVVLFYFLDNYGSKEKVKVLEQHGSSVISLLNTYMENRDNPIAASLLEQQLKSISSNTNPYIWVIDNNGYLIFRPNNIPVQIARKLKNEGERLRLPDERQYKKVIRDKQEFQETGDFYGLFKDTDFSWLMIAKPFIYNEKVLGAVYLYTPISDVKKTRTTVINFFMVSVAVSIAVSIILVYIFSLKISKPLKQIRNAAREISDGEFEKRLDINSKDEIGELAISFNQMATALQNLEQMRRGFIANVSHELRTPMTSIRGFVEGILDGTIPTEKQNSYLIIVKDEVIRLNRLVNDLLDLAKMESGETTLCLKNLSITELIRRCIIKLENLIIRKNLHIEADFEEENMFVYADMDAIERVIINLIHNAVKFSNENGSIKLTAYNQKNKIIISIEDNGVGIDRDEMNLIWDRFYKSDKSRSNDKSGTGLGLAIIRSILNEHNEEIWVESELGKGTKFTFTLEKATKNDIAD